MATQSQETETPVFWNSFIKSTGYDHRATQDELVTLISDTLHNQGYLVARAGTGTGKSLASVIPALEFALTRAAAAGPVIVSTATKGLQGQYAKKDLPFMEQHYANPQTKTQGFTHAVLKGKKNYVCLDKLAMPSAPVPKAELDAIAERLKTTDGDVVNVGIPRMYEHAVTISAADCPGKMECQAHLESLANGQGGCRYEAAKERAAKSNVMVINHALLATHLKIMSHTQGKVQILPPPSAFVLDECHKFPGYVQNALGWFLTTARLFRWANDCLDGEDNEEFKEYVRNFFKNIDYDTKDKKNLQQIVSRQHLQGDKDMVAMISVVKDAMDDWAMIAQDTRETADRRKASQCRNLLLDLEVTSFPDSNDNFWAELDKQGNKILNYKPGAAKVADFLREYMWPIAPAVMLSATPPAEPKEILGLDEWEEFDADSPFNFKDNSRLYISKLDGSPPFDSQERMLWEQKRHAEMFKLVAAADGRALLLFTSWVDLNKAYEFLAPRFTKNGVTVLRQEKENESERDRLAKVFKEDERSVLFGTESFFEGIDIPGDSLRLVVLSKLPFPAMVDNTRGGKLDFRKEMLPEMRMKAVQAAGRLIRTHEDKGLVAVLDNRMITKGYGKNLVANISPFSDMGYVNTLSDACEYLESLEEE